jgi:hypothetical protein
MFFSIFFSIADGLESLSSVPEEQPGHCSAGDENRLRNLPAK